jgi:predicted kinase
MPILNSPFIQAVHEKYWPTLKYLNVPHDKLIIGFSAIPGSGKTTLAKEIAERYQGVRINKDEVWDIAHPLEAQFQGEDYETLVRNYMSYLMQELSNYPNGLIVNDASLDRQHEKVKEWADNNGYELFLIRIPVTREVLESRILERNKAGAGAYLEKLDNWMEDFNKLNETVRADFEWDQTDLSSKETLFQALSQYI